MTSAAMTLSPSLSSRLRASAVSASELASHLDSLDEAGRVREIRTLTGRDLKALWKACADAGPLSLDEFMPQLPDGQTVIYAGRNSLPLFSDFEKRFARQGGAVIGYNEGPTRGLVGPGYFTVLAAENKPKELLFDYERVPATAPAGWPAVKPNDRGVSTLVFGHLHDFCRRVATGVVIGIGTRRGKEMNAFFALARAV